MTIKRKRLPVSVSAAVFIEDEKGRLLLLQQDSEEKEYKWGPPAGGMKAHEGPETTAKREAEEELGVKVTLLNLIGIYTVDRGFQASGMTFVFRGKIESGEIAPKRGEIRNYRFFTQEQIDELISKGELYKPEYNKFNIEDWKKGKSYSLNTIRPLIQ